MIYSQLNHVSARTLVNQVASFQVQSKSIQFQELQAQAFQQFQVLQGNQVNRAQFQVCQVQLTVLAATVFQ
jgi:hypothetical protein